MEWRQGSGIFKVRMCAFEQVTSDSTTCLLLCMSGTNRLGLQHPWSQTGSAEGRVTSGLFMGYQTISALQLWYGCLAYGKNIINFRPSCVRRV